MDVKMGGIVRCVPYDSAWRTSFEAISSMLREILGDCIQTIEHVGSTAVVGLWAKPIIDIDVVVASKEAFQQAKVRLEAAGFRHKGDQGIPTREAFERIVPDLFPPYHLYVCCQDSPELARHLAFREHLKNDATDRQRYSDIKKEAARLYPTDIDSYIAFKADVIRSIYAKIGLSPTEGAQKITFPIDFVFGAATSAYQIEGAYNEDGRGQIMWDVINRDASGKATAENGDVACDHYHRYVEDVALMQSMHLQSYRFSISWVRIFPNGHGEVNPLGVRFYHNLIDRLLEAGITPAVTTWHGDLPLVYETIGGWTNPVVIEHYVEYVQFLFSEYGDQVKLWFTHNEPWCAAFLNQEPFEKQLLIAHHLLLAHAKAVELYHKHPKGNGKIGIVLNLGKQYPASEDPLDTIAANNVDGFLNRWFLDPLWRGTYPEDMLVRYRDAGHTFTFSPMDIRFMANHPGDFLGINVYSRGVQKFDANNTLLQATDAADPVAPRTEMGWEIAPSSLHDLLIDLHQNYPGMEIRITENGGAFPDTQIEADIVQDDDRLAYLRAHLRAVHQAILEGCPVTAYYYWSLFDNFEWGQGYAKRFGIVRVDYNTQKRSIKKSGYFYVKTIQNRGFSE